jgi:hypothetical protein
VKGRRFVAHEIYGKVDDGILAWMDNYVRRTNPEIPADAEMVWDEGTGTVRWVWDERIAWKPSCAKCDSGFSEHRCHMEDR